MRKRLAVLAVIAGLAGANGAQAQVFEIPPPPTLEPQYALGARYWQSVGKTRFSINSSKQNPAFGNPTSVLTYEDMDGFSGEFFWYARNDYNTFAKGFVGGGAVRGGSLDDEDYFAGQVKFSDTYSKIKGDDLIYGTIDVGQRFMLADRTTIVALSPFIGLNFWQETAAAYGVRCNPDDIGGAFCPTDSVVVPFSVEVINNEANWASLRLGGELKIKLWDRLTLMGEGAVLPVAYVWNLDSHILRTDLGRLPNVEDRGTGWGYQLEAALRFDFTEQWSAGAGVRYWYASVGGTSEFVNFGTKVPLKDFTSERFGVYGDISYNF